MVRFLTIEAGDDASGWEVVKDSQKTETTCRVIPPKMYKSILGHVSDFVLNDLKATNGGPQ